MIPEIVFPAGVGGNHVRWLLSIDPKFNLAHGGASVDDKVDWICKNIYHNRTWNNWLAKESQYRNQLDSIMMLKHSVTQPGEMFYHPDWQEKKQLLLTVDDPIMASYHYFMVNIGLNNQTKDTMMRNLTQWQEISDTIESLNLSTKKILKSDCIIRSDLDLDWYKEITNWAGFDDLYEPANRIQGAYHQCRQQAARDFVAYFEGQEFKSHLDFYKRKYIEAQI